MGNEAVRWLMNGDVQLALEQRGSGPQHILFVHGWISSRRMWYDVAEQLSGSEYTLHLLDIRGCGDSDRPLDGHDLEGYVSDVATALNAIPSATILVGHSMGARLAQRLASEAQNNIAGLMLIAPGTARGGVVVPRQRELAARACGSRRRIGSFQRGAMIRPVTDVANQRLIDDALFAQREHWFGWYDSGRVADFSAALRRVQLPTAVIAGEADPLIPVGRVQREVVAEIAGATLSVVPGCGHNIPIEAPQIVADAIIAFARALQTAP